MTADRARILVGVPAYGGAVHIAETLRSIQDQDCDAFRVVISVDDGDPDTAAACKPFVSDPRFSLVIQDCRLGWDGNINWLMSQTRCEFFCYWQQDDFTSTDYLSALVTAADENPAAVCVYSDIQWIGAKTGRAICDPVTGFALERALRVLETMNGVPFRGLIRSSVLQRTGPIRRTAYESALEEFIWLAKLAREGNLWRVPGPLYFKRKHKDSLWVKWDARDAAWKRAVWIEYGLGMLEVIWPVVPDAERDVALAVVLDRLCGPRGGRFLFYDPAAELLAFAAEFVAQARAQFGFAKIEDAMAADTAVPRFAGGIAGDLLDRVVRRSGLRRDVRRGLEQEGEIELGFRAGSSGVSLLDQGWSVPEAWGTWSNGAAATLRLPLPDKGPWRLRITCMAFGAVQQSRTVSVSVDGRREADIWCFDSDQELVKALQIEAESGDTIMQFSFPDAVSPFDLGVSEDRRLLGILLVSVRIARAIST